MYAVSSNLRRFLIASLLLLGALSLQAQKSYFPMGGVTRYSNGTYYFAKSGLQYVTPGEVVTAEGEIVNCAKAGKKCAQLLSQAARESVEQDYIQFADADALTGSAPIIDLVKDYDSQLSESGEEKPGIYFFDYREQTWKYMKFFKESHVKVMKSLKK